MTQIPEQAKFFEQNFDGDFIESTFYNSNPNYLFVFCSNNNICIKVDENKDSFSNNISVKLVINSRHGTVRTEEKEISYDDPRSDNVGKINKAKKMAISRVFNKEYTLYESWVNEFSEDSVVEDKR